MNRNKTLNKFIIAYVFYLVIFAILFVGCYWMLHTEISTEGKSIGFIRRMQGRMTVGGYGGFIFFTPFLLSAVKNLLGFLLDRFSNQEIELDIDTNSYSEYYAPFLTFNIVDVPKKINPNKLLLIVSFPWRYVFTNKYYYLSRDVANIKQFEKKGEIYGKLHITATKYSHVILSIEKASKK